MERPEDDKASIAPGSSVGELNANGDSSEQAKTVSKIKHDWYQTESDVFVNVLAKNLSKDSVSVEFSSEKLKVCAKLPDGLDYELQLDLFRSIDPAASSFKVLSTKIEARLRKLDASSWPSLDAAKPPAEIKPSYPSSSKKHVDWGKLEKDIEKDTKDEGDVNSLFSKIYNSGDENTKRAMIKSMQESGGTVLSTNWEDIGKKPTECSPPDGMEWKKWD